MLRGVSFELAPGRYGEVTGANGSGKTTLLRAICGLAPREEGQILWCGTAQLGMPTAGFRAQLGYLGHDPALKADLTALENLRYAVGLHRRVDARELQAGLERTGAAGFARRGVRTLSAGQRRRVALAALWLKRATLWVLDEPTTNLDAAGQRLVGQLLTEHLDSGGLVLAAVHAPIALEGARTLSIALDAAPGSPGSGSAT